MKKYIGLLILIYLRYFAKKQLTKNLHAVTIGITGSLGKTSTRHALARVLSLRGTVKQSLHANSESGIPLNILGMTMSNYSPLSWIKVIFLAPWRYLTFYEKYDYYIVEMGIDSPDSPKNMDYLLSIIRPDMAIILGASLTHAASFDHLVKDKVPARKTNKILNLIAKEKMKLAHAIPPTGTVVINDDDPYIRAHSKGIKARLLRVGHSVRANYRIKSTSIKNGGLNISWSYQHANYILKTNNFLGIEYGLTMISSLALAHSLGTPIDQASYALSSYLPPAGRMRVFEGIKNTHILDSSYNASPASMFNSLSTLNALAPKSRKIAVLGDMRELGVLTKSAHQTLAKQIPKYVDIVFLYGSLMSNYVLPSLIRQHVATYYADSMEELISQLKNQIKPGDWILIKGSQNTILLERAVQALLKDPRDRKRLCRRGDYWDRIRASTR